MVTSNAKWVMGAMKALIFFQLGALRACIITGYTSWPKLVTSSQALREVRKRIDSAIFSYLLTLTFAASTIPSVLAAPVKGVADTIVSQVNQNAVLLALGMLAGSASEESPLHGSTTGIFNAIANISWALNQKMRKERPVIRYVARFAQREETRIPHPVAAEVADFKYPIGFAGIHAVIMFVVIAHSAVMGALGDSLWLMCMALVIAELARIGNMLLEYHCIDTYWDGQVEQFYPRPPSMDQCVLVVGTSVTLNTLRADLTNDEPEAPPYIYVESSWSGVLPAVGSLTLAIIQAVCSLVATSSVVASGTTSWLVSLYLSFLAVAAGGVIRDGRVSVTKGLLRIRELVMQCCQIDQLLVGPAGFPELDMSYSEYTVIAAVHPNRMIKTANIRTVPKHVTYLEAEKCYVVDCLAGIESYAQHDRMLRRWCAKRDQYGRPQWLYVAEKASMLAVCLVKHALMCSEGTALQWPAKLRIDTGDANNMLLAAASHHCCNEVGLISSHVDDLWTEDLLRYLIAEIMVPEDLLRKEARDAVMAPDPAEAAVRAATYKLCGTGVHLDGPLASILLLNRLLKSRSIFSNASSYRTFCRLTQQQKLLSQTTVEKVVYSIEGWRLEYCVGAVAVPEGFPPAVTTNALFDEPEFYSSFQQVFVQAPSSRLIGPPITMVADLAVSTAERQIEEVTEAADN